MRVRPAPASPLYPKLRFVFTDHPITVWAGVILLRLYVELLDLRNRSHQCADAGGQDLHPSDSRRRRPAGLVVRTGAGRRTV